MDSLYQKMYYDLFNAVTDALNALEAKNTVQARWLLVRAQQNCEELYLQQIDETQP